jgi:acyl homoserine lactone synthase
MILTIDALNMHKFQPLLDDMYRLRARVFGGRLGWEVNIEDDMEIDQFDRLDPAYIIGLDDDMNVISCARVLQTTGPHMLSDVFQAILDGEPPLRSPSIWESTRFCVDTQRLKRETSGTTVSKATCELMIGILEYAQSAGIQDIITVIDPVMDRVLKRSDNAPHGYVGKTVQMGKVPALAALLDCSDERIERVRAFGGIAGDVFISEDDAYAKLTGATLDQADNADPEVMTAVKADPAKVAEAKTRNANVEDLQNYCLEQLTCAKTDAERKAAVALLNTLSEQIGDISPSTFNQFNRQAQMSTAPLNTTKDAVLRST